MNKKLDRNYYDVLGLMRDATTDDIKRAYKKAALQAHPDKGGSDEMFQRVNEAYTVLNDPVKKIDYDKVRTARARVSRLTCALRTSRSST